MLGKLKKARQNSILQISLMGQRRTARKGPFRVLSGIGKKVKRAGTTLIRPGRGSTEQIAETFWSDGSWITRQDSKVGWSSMVSRDSKEPVNRGSDRSWGEQPGCLTLRFLLHGQTFGFAHNKNISLSLVSLGWFNSFPSPRWHLLKGAQGKWKQV